MRKTYSDISRDIWKSGITSRFNFVIFYLVSSQNQSLCLFSTGFNSLKAFTRFQRLSNNEPRIKSFERAVAGIYVQLS